MPGDKRQAPAAAQPRAKKAKKAKKAAAAGGVLLACTTPYNLKHALGQELTLSAEKRVNRARHARPTLSESEQSAQDKRQVRHEWHDVSPTLVSPAGGTVSMRRY